MEKHRRKTTNGDAVSLGTQIVFFVQRIMYLHQHPDARPGQKFLDNDDAAFTDVLVTGSVVDLLVDISGGTLSAADFAASLTDDGVELRLGVRRSPDETRPGYQIMKGMSSSIVFDADKRCLTIKASGASVAAGLPGWTGKGCRPVIVG